jgi:hypothetical protein
MELERGSQLRRNAQRRRAEYDAQRRWFTVLGPQNPQQRHVGAICAKVQYTLRYTLAYREPKGPPTEAALLRRPAALRKEEPAYVGGIAQHASLFQGLALLRPRRGIKRAASSASMALASQSTASLKGSARFICRPVCDQAWPLCGRAAKARHRGR